MRNIFKLPRLKSVLMSAVLVMGAAASSLAPLFGDYTAEAASGNNLSSIYPSKMTKMKLSLVYTGKEIDGTVNSTQSFAITDKYFIVVQAHSTKENAGWIVATNYKKPSSTPAWKAKYNIGHGNGATWNSKKNQIVVIDGSTKYFFNANNGKYVTKVTTGPSGSGIAYDAKNDHYIQTSGRSATSGQILNSNFTLIKTFDAGHRLVSQDVAYNDGYIYRIGWGGCNYLKNHNLKDDATYCSKYFGEGSNVVYQFDSNGKYVNAYYTDAGFGELESMAFGTDGAPYLMFNSKPDSSHYSVYKLNNLSKPASVPQITAVNTTKPAATTTTTKPATTSTTTSKPATTSTTTTKPATTTTITKPVTTTTTTTTTTKPATTNTTTTTKPTTSTTTTTKPATTTATTKPATTATTTTKPTITTTTTTTTTTKPATTNTTTTTKPVTTTTTTTKPAASTDTSTTKPATTTTTKPVTTSRTVTNTVNTTKPAVTSTTTTTKPTTITTTTNTASTTSTSTAVPTIVDTSVGTDTGVQVSVNTEDNTKTNVKSDDRADVDEMVEIEIPKAGKTVTVDDEPSKISRIVITLAVLIGALAILYYLVVIFRYSR